jgi:CubicO group peptidase (beta-lactamase class C family)
MCNNFMNFKKTNHIMDYLNKKLSFLFLVLLLASAYSQDKSQKIDEYMNKCYELGLFNGSVLVAEHGSVILKKGYGYANIEWKIPNEADTKFRLGSITKQFTAMLIMQLVEKGQIKLDGHISDYLPYYPKKTGDKITIHQLLSHTSGIFNYTNDPDFYRKDRFTPKTPEQLVKTFSEKELDFEPGTKWNYSNSGYIVLGAIIENVTGKSYEAVLQENILIPLGLRNTSYDHTDKIIEKRASGYDRSFDGFSNTAYLDMSLPFAAGSLYSTVEDLYMWGEYLYTDKLLSNESLKKMMTPVMNNYGYGLIINRISMNGTDSITAVGHSGGINGFNTNMVRMPEDKNTVILFCNVLPVNLNEITNSLIKILYGKPYDEPKKSAAVYLFDYIQSKGVNPAIDEFNQNKENYSVRESEINQLGYTLMAAGKMKDAIEIFKLNIELFPNSFNVYDSMGEAYMNNGDTELAIEKYKKSVELNPNNQNGIEALKKLEKK